MNALSAAFEEQGWDDLAQLQAINESELLLLAADVSMKSGHVARLKKALGLTQPVPQPVHTASALPSASPTPAPAAPAPSPIPPVALAPAPAVAARSVLVSTTDADVQNNPTAARRAGRGYYVDGPSAVSKHKLNFRASL
jgi:hypothetical protein